MSAVVDSLTARPCKYCAAAWDNDIECCRMAHEHPVEEIEALAIVMANVFQGKNPTDEQVGWFMEDADAVVADFDPRPEKWKIRKLPDSGDEFVARFRINDVTYVIEDGDGHIPPVRLSTFRQWQREADEAAGIS